MGFALVSQGMLALSLSPKIGETGARDVGDRSTGRGLSRETTWKGERRGCVADETHGHEISSVFFFFFFFFFTSDHV